MKKIALLLLLPLFIACSSDDDNNDPVNAQDYTSFVVTNNFSGTAKNIVVGYRLSDGTLKKVADVGDLEANKTSKEFKVDYATIKAVSLFYDAVKSDGSIGTTSPVFLDKTIQEKKKNVLELPKGFMTDQIADKNDPTEYPQ